MRSHGSSYFAQAGAAFSAGIAAVWPWLQGIGLVTATPRARAPAGLAPPAGLARRHQFEGGTPEARIMGPPGFTWLNTFQSLFQRAVSQLSTLE